MHAATDAAIDPAYVLWDERRPVDDLDDHGAASVSRADSIAAAAVVMTIVAFAMMFQLMPGACALTGGPGMLVPC
ncbi:MAG TPA: hypothetical protein VF744_05920 [Beijerinckiaceae bacterium]